MFTILIENSLDYKSLLFLMASVYILLFLKLFYLKFKSDDFVNSNNIIIRSIRESIIGRRLFFSSLSTRNRLDLCDGMARLLRFFVGHPSRNSIFTGATLRAGF